MSAKRRGRQSRERVRFKITKNNQFKDLTNRMAQLKITSQLEIAENMDDFGLTSSYEGSLLSKGKALTTNPFGWYQVTLQNGQRYAKDVVIRKLLAILYPETLTPHYWRIGRGCVVFFVDDFNIAQCLKQYGRCIQMHDGRRLYLNVRSNCPLETVDEAFKEKMKLAMNERYNSQTKTLDLSRFHADPKFKNMCVVLFRYSVMSAALDIIVQNIPDLVAIYMNDNGLVGMEGFKNIAPRLRHLESVHLANNKIPCLGNLDALRNCRILELVLEGNPLRLRYKEKTQYISEVVRKFPKLQKFDGEIMVSQNQFELGAHSSLLKAKAAYFCNKHAAGIIEEFLKTYFKLFDSDNRSALIASYHLNAMMSITVPHASQAGRLDNFWNFNRNLLRIMKYTKNDLPKYRLLKVGNFPIVAVLMELPRTQHDLQSFSVDQTLHVVGKMMIFTVAGLFKELDSATINGSDKIRYFRRDFVVVPNGPRSICIRNEMFFVTNATAEQAKTFMRGRNAASTTITGSCVQSPARIPQTILQQAVAPELRVPVAPSLPAQPDENTKNQMVQSLQAQTTMNLEWSRKCLEQRNWDYNDAFFTFDELNKENKIPVQAFIK